MATPEISDIIETIIKCGIVAGPIAGIFLYSYLDKRSNKKTELKNAFNLPEESNPSYSKLTGILKAVTSCLKYEETGNKKYIKKIKPELKKILKQYDIINESQNTKKIDVPELQKFYKSEELKKYLISK